MGDGTAEGTSLLLWVPFPHWPCPFLQDKPCCVPSKAPMRRPGLNVRMFLKDFTGRGALVG